MRNRPSLPAGSWLALTVALAATPARAFACPSCESGRLVRAAVWSSSPAQHLLFIALPFLILGAMAVLVQRVGASRSRGRETRR